MGLLVPYYPVQLWYTSFISIVVLVTSLVLFYVYTKSLLPFVAVAPAMVLFLTSHNIAFYTLSYIPLLLAIYYDSKTSATKDLMQGKRLMISAFILVVVVGVASCVYAHYAYTDSSSRIAIGNMAPIITLIPNPNSGGYSVALSGLNVNVTYYGSGNGTLSFYLLTRKPKFQGYTLGSELRTFSPGAQYNYVLNCTLPSVDNNTEILLIVFDKNYFASKKINLVLNIPHQLAST
jgi:hypothetical protein